ncbi:F-box/kelch-repeat protein At3g23880-like [Spinacia oleracea]|uniref:F-box/kelch-repeat protein At3g23880-like n=1 Tax=Spinacia oleracea TaxID=3562 RepID=A0ABM3RNC7_SPIOL|nr:F-box/kelch-repeat protein At3g23880-like [Spinacia oleracea]
MEGKSQRDDVQSPRHLPHLPDDIIFKQILPWLPIKPLTRFKAVSKEWYTSISSPNFILNYTKKPLFSHPGKPLESVFIESGGSFYLYSCEHEDNVQSYAEENNNNLVRLNVEFDIDETDRVDLEGCSNGLVCLTSYHGKYFILWNPATNQYQKYMCLPYLHISGFGYVSSLDDYKVVGIMSDRKGCKQCHVFSLKSNTWEKIEFDFDGYFLLADPIFVNQTLHWTALCHSTQKVRIVAFDLALGTLEWFPLLSFNKRKPPGICVMGGCLSKLDFNSQNDLVIEIVKRSGEVFPVCFSCASSWYDINYLIGFTKTGKIFVVFHNPRMFGLVDPSSKQPFSLTEDQGILKIDSYVPSQISPHSPMDLQNARELET